MRKAITVIVYCLLFIVPMKALAQEARISGTINDNLGPVMMCNVVEVDANNRNISFTQTDMNGNFSMTVKNVKNKLKISYVGYKTQTLPIGTRTRCLFYYLVCRPLSGKVCVLSTTMQCLEYTS